MHLDPKTWWYLTRAAGFVAWALLAASVLWGLFITNKTLVKSTAPAWVLDLHRHLGGLAVVFLAIHIGSLPLDGYTHWDAADLFVPMHTVWHPLAIAWGIVGMYLLLAIEITSLLGRRFPRTWWRRVHMLSFPLYVVASIHLFAAGSDARNVFGQWMVVIVSTLIAFLTGLRILAVTNPREVPSRVPRAARERVATDAPPDRAPATAPAAPAAGSDPAAVPAPDPRPAPTTAASPTPAPDVTPVPAGATGTTADLLPNRTPTTAGPPRREPAPARPEPAIPAPARPATADERAAKIRAAARLAAERHATAPDSRNAAMSGSANPQA